jgi:hypothetical protein
MEPKWVEASVKDNNGDDDYVINDIATLKSHSSNTTGQYCINVDCGIQGPFDRSTGSNQNILMPIERPAIEGQYCINYNSTDMIRTGNIGYLRAFEQQSLAPVIPINKKYQIGIPVEVYDEEDKKVKTILVKLGGQLSLFVGGGMNQGKDNVEFRTPSGTLKNKKYFNGMAHTYIKGDCPVVAARYPISSYEPAIDYSDWQEGSFNHCGSGVIGKVKQKPFYCTYSITYNCISKEWNGPVLLGTSTTGIESNWTWFSGQYHYRKTTFNWNECLEPEDTPEYQEGYCVYRWVANWNCSLGTAGEWEVSFNQILNPFTATYDWTGDYTKYKATTSDTPPDPPAGTMPCSYWWQAVKNCNTGVWTIALLGVSQFEWVVDWVKTSTNTYQCRTSTNEEPEPPEVDCLYLWEATYDCDEEEWSFELITIEIPFVEYEEWTLISGNTFRIHTNSDEEPDPPDIGQVTCGPVHEWEATYDCETGLWNFYDYGEVEEEPTAWDCWGNTCFRYAGEDQPEPPSIEPSCYYYWSAYYDCWTEQWYAWLDWVDESGTYSGWNCYDYGYGYCECYSVTNSLDEPALPEYPCDSCDEEF